MKHIIDDSDKNKYEAYTKTEVLNVIQQAIATGELPEELNGLVITLKNSIDNKGYKIAFCTQAKYNELEAAGTLELDCYYFITDDTTVEDIFDSIGDVETDLNDFISDLAILINTKRINIYNGDGYIYGDNEGYLYIKASEDIEFGYGTETINLSDIYKSTPVNVPIDSGNTSCNILDYGLGLYEVTIKKTSGNTTYYHTGRVSIVDEGIDKAADCFIPAGTSYQSIEWVAIVGSIGVFQDTPIGTISISNSSSGYTIAKCTRLIKY